MNVPKKSPGNFIKKLTSSVGLFQFSVLKAYKVIAFTPNSSAAIAILLTVLIPSLCPAILGRLRFFAQRPFPSIITAMCFGILLESKEIISVASSFFDCFFQKTMASIPFRVFPFYCNRCCSSFIVFYFQD